MVIEFTKDEIDRILAYQRVAYVHCLELIRLGQTTDPPWDERDNSILQKLTNDA